MVCGGRLWGLSFVEINQSFLHFIRLLNLHLFIASRFILIVQIVMDVSGLLHLDHYVFIIIDIVYVDFNDVLFVSSS